MLDTIRAVISVADVVLIPARPIPHDLRAVGVVVETRRKARKPHIMVLNAAIARKGEASPAHVATAMPAGDETVKLSVKLTPEEHMRLMQPGLRSRPRRSNQKMIREAVRRYLAEAEDPGPMDEGWDGRRPIEP